MASNFSSCLKPSAVVFPWCLYILSRAFLLFSLCCWFCSDSPGTYCIQPSFHTCATRVHFAVDPQGIFLQYIFILGTYKMGGPVQHYYTKTFLMVCVIQKHRVTYVSMQKKEKENVVTKLWLKKSYIDQVHTLMNRGQEVEVSIANQKELI